MGRLSGRLSPWLVVQKHLEGPTNGEKEERRGVFEGEKKKARINYRYRRGSLLRCRLERSAAMEADRKRITYVGDGSGDTDGTRVPRVLPRG